MKQKKRFINLFDILIVLILSAAIILIAVFIAPDKKTVSVGYTLTVTEGDVSALSEGDAMTVLSGGCLGKVVKTGDGYIEAAADAEYHAGQYYSGAVALKDGEEYVFCVGVDRFVCTLHRITER